MSIHQTKENIKNVISCHTNSNVCQEIDTATEKWRDRLKIMFMNTVQSVHFIIEMLRKYVKYWKFWDPSVGALDTARAA